MNEEDNPIREERFRLRYEYASRKRQWLLRKAVDKVFEEIDPERLISYGCPHDEYDAEIQEITAQIDRERGVAGKIPLSEEDVATIVAIVMHLAYGTWRELPKVHDRDREIARKILEEEAMLLTERDMRC
jgi:hypothetical protein